MRPPRRVLLTILVLSLALGGCAGVRVSSINTKEYMELRRGDVLTTGDLSVGTMSALQVMGCSPGQHDADRMRSREALRTTSGLGEEARLSALAELWLQEAILHDKRPQDCLNTAATLNAYLEAARHAYAYLFFTARSPADRALEDRQAQVRDYYNFAVQESVAALIDLARHAPPRPGEPLRFGAWSIAFASDTIRLAHGRAMPDQLIPAASLSFKGLRNQYRRDGLGAELVAVTSKRVVSAKSARLPFSETPFPALTAVMKFSGATQRDVLTTRDILIGAHDPYTRETVRIAGRDIPLAANFTSGYGLWLARSGFATQSLLTLFGKGEVLETPRIYLLQPYNPNRRVIVMLHGLASSPEAWINMANEVLGDEELRRRYQIWQVYYPTNSPIAFNNLAIREALNATLLHFDPTGTAPASRNMVVIGHSMGGVLARLLVSSSGNRLWEAFVNAYRVSPARRERVRTKMQPYMMFEPLPQIGRAVFIAAPHRGTPLAKHTVARWIANLMTVPFSVLGRLTEVAQLLVDPGSAPHASLRRPFNSIDGLRDNDPFIRATADLPIPARVPYHSIIGWQTPESGPANAGSDGIVPYASAHLEGAQSEKCIASGHSVQETPEAILEIRRILAVHLQSEKTDPAPTRNLPTASP